jgi:hypothetical protein
VNRLIPLLLVLAGCDFAFGDGDDEMCKSTPVVDLAPDLQLHDPYTNQCIGYGGGGGYCDPSCGPCPPVQNPPLPPYGACQSTCTGLAEDACLAAPGCQASYDDYGAGEAPAFSGCWQVASGGPAAGGACEGRDAVACAQDDQCAAYYTGGFLGTLRDALPAALAFERCATEPSMHGCDDVACDANSHCELQCAPCDSLTGECPCAPTCVPDGDACAATDCAPGYTCVERCDGTTPTDGGAMPPAMCATECVPTGDGDPGSCTGPVDCSTGEPACPTGTVAGIVDGCWSGYCIPEADCGPNDPGGCEPAVCTTPGPTCPAGTVGGTADGCWTGYCIPASACPQVACEQLATESACAARGDCEAVYEGTTCTCDPSCTCEELTFDRCTTVYISPPGM